LHASGSAARGRLPAGKPVTYAEQVRQKVVHARAIGPPEARGDEVLECCARGMRAVHGFKKHPCGTPRRHAQVGRYEKSPGQHVRGC
jgi:hypothetical protein